MTYNKSNQFYDKKDGLTLCGCMGPIYDEPFCPCQMAQLGLPMSKDHVEATERDKQNWTLFVNAFSDSNVRVP